MKKVVSIIILITMVMGIVASACAITCETCGQTFSQYCNKKHHHYGSYIQCQRQTNCDYRANYYSNYYRDSNGHERITNYHFHECQHTYCGNSWIACSLPPKP